MKQPITKVRDDAVRGAPREMLEELFQDFYAHRYKIYFMNLVREITFGFGSVVGATLVVALLLWMLSWFNELPFVGDFVRNVQHSIEAAAHK